MKTSLILAVCFVAACFAASSFAQGTAGSPTTTSPSVATSPVAAPAGEPNGADMMKQMMELSKLNENHKLLADTAGEWNYTLKMWMNPDPNAKPQEAKGTATRKMIMGGRYLSGEYTGHMQMPGPDGKMKDTVFKGMGLEAYDNVKKKFVASWVDNMGTGIEMSEGTYDPATKSFTYTSEVEPVPGMKTQIREVIKLTDKNHMTLEWYETQAGQEKKTMEIDYTKKQ